MVLLLSLSALFHSCVSEELLNSECWDFVGGKMFYARGAES